MANRKQRSRKHSLRRPQDLRGPRHRSRKLRPQTRHQNSRVSRRSSRRSRSRLHRLARPPLRDRPRWQDKVQKPTRPLRLQTESASRGSDRKHKLKCMWGGMASCAPIANRRSFSSQQYDLQPCFCGAANFGGSRLFRRLFLGRTYQAATIVNRRRGPFPLRRKDEHRE